MNSILRKKLKSGFTTVPNDLLSDPGISWKAKGILIYLLSKPDNWKVFASDIAKQSKDGIDAVYSGIKELCDARYVWKTPRGGIDVGGWEYVVSDYRNQENPFNDESPNRENPHSAFPTTNKTDRDSKTDMGSSTVSSLHSETSEEPSSFSPASQAPNDLGRSGKTEQPDFFPPDPEHAAGKPYAKGAATPKAGNPNPPGSAAPPSPIGNDKIAGKTYALGSRVMAKWNALGLFGKIRSFDSKRQTALRKLLREVPDFGDTWEKAIDMASHNSFLRGENKRGWKLDFDSFLTPRIYNRILEGCYDRGAKSENGDDYGLVGI